MAVCAAAGLAPAQPKTVDVLVFQGGYGVDFFQKAAKEFEAEHPGVQIKIQGDPRAWDVLIPRLAAGTPPDLVWPGWGMNLMPSVREGQLLPWNKYLQEPALGMPGKTWRQTFKEDILKKGEFNGQVLVLPFNIDVYGWWYDKKLFDQHGWQPPNTYEEFMQLAEKMKAVDIAPLTFQGRYPQYMQNGIFYPWIVSAGGIEALNSIMQKKPNAWKHPAVLRAARAIMECKHRHYFESGAIGMTHMESQMELLVHRAAMIPCGSWIQAEMKNLLPPGFELNFTKTPVFADGAGDPTALYVGADGKGFCLPAKGHNHDEAAEFYRYVASPKKSREFIEQKGTLTAITPDHTPNLPPHLVKPFEAFQKANVTWANDLADWDTELNTECETSLTDLYNEIYTPEEFVEHMNEKAEAYRKKLEQREAAGR